jgi:hypothetical protein
MSKTTQQAQSVIANSPFWREKNPIWLRGEVDRLRASVAALEAQLAEARKDSQRMNYLSGFWDSQTDEPQPVAFFMQVDGSLRGSIDNAMEMRDEGRHSGGEGGEG